MPTNPEAADQQVDTASCASEPIHIPGSIQPHGMLLAVDEPALQVQHASDNCCHILGIAAAQICGLSLQGVLTPASWQHLLQQLQTPRLQTVNPIKLALICGDSSKIFDAIAHRSQGLLLLEFEPAAEGGGTSFSNIYQRIYAAVEEIGAARDLAELYRVTAEQVKAISGYQRVMIYQFDPQWNGKVVAEALEPEQEPFLGLQYPATDIPEQARRLYRSNWLRIIPQVDYTPSPIIPGRQHNGEPLDLSGCVLRSVSPMHVQYLKNMGVGASMSVSVITDGELWGLIALHHRDAAFLPYDVRQGLEFIGKFFSSQLGAKQKTENAGRKQFLKSLQPLLLKQMKAESAFMDGLHRGPASFLQLAEGVSGGAILHRGKLSLYGQTPSEQQVAKLAVWLTAIIVRQRLYHTHSLANTSCPNAQQFKHIASGLLAIAIPEVEPSLVMWFKPEVIQTVNWGGNPNKSLEQQDAGGALGPRRSFALWQQTVESQSLPWQNEEIEAAEALRRSLIEVDLERQVRAATDSNTELDQFTSVISHDLKEPLRGIRYFADFLAEDAGELLTGPAREHLDGILQLSDKATTLVTELYEYSRLGQLEMAFAEVDMNSVVSEVHRRLQGLFRQYHVTLQIDAPLPTVYCDRVRVAEVFANLLSNAVKYSDARQRIVEVGARVDSAVPVFFVRDNGIGIAKHARERIFRMFQRLHEEGDFGGGSGVGLAIVKRIIDRHNGRLWVESTPGKGSTFYFTLRPVPQDNMSRSDRGAK